VADMNKMRLLVFLIVFPLAVLGEALEKKIQQDSHNIAMLSASAVYHLDKEELPSILTPFLKENKNIKALYLEENLEKEKLLRFFRDSKRGMVFNENIPSGFKGLSHFETSVKYDGNEIGRVIVYYASDRLNFTPKEKELIEKTKQVVYILKEEKKPFQWESEQQEYQGIFIDTLDLVSEKNGLKFKVTKEMQDNVVFATLREKGIEKDFYLTKNDFLKIPAVLIENVQSNNIYFDDISDLKNKKVAVLKNSRLKSYLEKKFPQVKLTEIDKLETGFDILKSKKIDFYALNGITAQYLLKMKKYDGFKIYRKLDFTFHYKIAVHKTLPKELVSVLDKTLATIDNDEKSRIFYKWTTMQIKKELDWILLRDIALFFFVVISFVIYWNRKLKRTVDEKTSELKKLNANLENIVSKEIKKNQDIQEQLFRSEKLASMGEMIGNIAHQWRQPLSVISSVSTALEVQKRMNILDEEELFKSCKTINDNAQYLSKTIDDFRNFIKGEKKKEQFLLKELFESCDNLVRSTLKNNHITAVYNLDENIHMEGYKNELLQCFLNIINNSKDALVEEDKCLADKYIFIDAYLKEEKIYITFKDNAGGICDTIKNRVFEPYFTTKHKSQGTGLGLNMVYNIIVNGMEGKIAVENDHFKYDGKDCKGAKFTIILNKQPGH
jgi:signal transduction histidine kinase